MIKRALGGMISVNSLIEQTDREELTNNIMIKTSSAIRESAKIGLQRLYADIDDVMETYKDFDLIKAMKDRKDANLLWVRARAIDSNIVNENGDLFSEEELTKVNEYQGKKMPAYKTFEGVPIYSNHKNDDIDEARGLVVHASWDDEEKCVYTTFFIDADAYPQLVAGIKQGYIHDVSMGASVELGICSICQNEATTEKDYCFVPGTLITMSDGSLKLIEHIEIGDSIISHNGRSKKVTRLSVNEIKDNVLKISSNGTYLPLIVTQNHPFLGLSQDSLKCIRDKRQICKPGQVGICYSGKKLNCENQTCFSNGNNLDPAFIHSGCLSPGDYIQSVTPKFQTNNLNLTYELAKFAGYYMAEGCLHKTSNAVILSFNANENEIIDDLEDIAQNLPNNLKSDYKFRHEIRSGTNALSWRWANKNLKIWLSSHCIGKAINKKLSEELFQDLCSNQDMAYAFISAFIDGDGHQGEKNIQIQLRTASLDLTNQIVQILSTLGIKASTFLQAQPGGPKNRDKLCYIWHININGFDAQHFIGKTFKVTAFNAQHHNTRYITTQYGFATPIYNIEKFYYEGPVYNFSVEDDESYIANGIAVHNCECLRKYKGKIHPSGKRAFEYNYGIKFIELSLVGIGAFEKCEILEIYDQDELLEKSQNTIRAAQSLNSSISLAAALHTDISETREIESALRQLHNLNTDIIRLAQTAGTLVGGQLIGGGSAQNATVVKILQGLGIDPSSSLNILDLTNLALNFLEVAVLNLFSRKDNIDLGHVAKLTKAMGELQNTLQDMIDDGIETSGPQNTQPMIPAQTPQQPAQPQAPQVPPMPTQTQSGPSVGTIISPFSQQPMVMPLGGGVSADSHSQRIVWASTNYEEPEQKLNKFGKFALALVNLKEACGISKTNEVVVQTPQKDKTLASSGDKNIMDHFKKIAQEQKNKNTVELAIDIKLDDKAGNRVVLSTDKGIKGYHKGQLTNWTPNLTDMQIVQMENGEGYKVASDLLKDFSSLIKTAEKEKTVDDLVVWEDNLEQDRDNVEIRTITDIDKQHKHEADDGNTYQTKLDARRKHNPTNEVWNSLLADERTNDLVRIVTELADNAQTGLGYPQLEEMLHPDFGKSLVPGKEIMCNVIDGIVKTCAKTSASPEEVITYLTKISESKSFPKILKLARLGTKNRMFNEIMTKFAQSDVQGAPVQSSGLAVDAPSAPPAGEDTMLDAGDSTEVPAPMDETAIKDVADTSTPETTEGEIISALNVIKDNFTEAVAQLDKILGKASPEGEPGKEDDMKDVLTGDDDLDKDTMNGAVTGLSLSGEDTGASPGDLVGAVGGMSTDDMASGIDKARSPSMATARATSRNTRSASKPALIENVIGWLADVANDRKIPSDKMALAAKYFCSYKDAAEGVLSRTIRTSEVKVVDETTHATTIYASLEDIGADVKDASFNEKFRDFAVNLLSTSGYEIDPTTFSLTDIEVSEDGMVCGKVSTRAVKTFNPETQSDHSPDYFDSDRDHMSKPGLPDMTQATEIPGMASMPGEIPGMPETPNMVMSESAKTIKRLARLQNIIKVAQGLGLPGAPAGGGGAGQAGGAGMAQGAGVAGDPMTSGAPGMAGGPGDLGLGSLTGAAGDGSEGINDQPEPGNKSPWGTICPQCGSKDIDIANGEGSCNSCNAQLKYKFIVEVAPGEDKGAEGMPADMGAMGGEAPLPPVGGIGAPEATAPTPGGMPAPGGAPGGLPPTASTHRIMTRVAYKTSADVYANALSEGFNKDIATKLPIGLICPSCGSRTASKKEKHTYCYDCGTLSISDVKRIDGEPGMLEASTIWI